MGQEIKRIRKGVVFAALLFFSPSLIFGDMEILELARAGGGRIDWDFFGTKGDLVLGNKRYTFFLESGWIVENYSRKLPGRVFRSVEGKVLVSSEAEGIFRNQIDAVRDSGHSIAAVLIDPGHGGRDPGAIGRHSVDGKKFEIYEKDVVLEVSLDLYEKLKNRYPEKRIMLTRDGDTFPSLEERVEMANSVGLAPHEAVIYISIHANASLNSKAKGYEVWYLPPDYRRTLIDQESIEAESEDVLSILNSMLEEEYTTESILLAQQILDGFTEQVGGTTDNRGLKEEIWFVVSKAKMPSVLIELGFVTNQEEALRLGEPDYLRKLAKAIYNGTSEFIDDFESTKGFTE